MGVNSIFPFDWFFGSLFVKGKITENFDFGE